MSSNRKNTPLAITNQIFKIASCLEKKLDPLSFIPNQYLKPFLWYYNLRVTIRKKTVKAKTNIFLKKRLVLNNIKMNHVGYVQKAIFIIGFVDARKIQLLWKGRKENLHKKIIWFFRYKFMIKSCENCVLHLTNLNRKMYNKWNLRWQ